MPYRSVYAGMFIGLVSLTTTAAAATNSNQTPCGFDGWGYAVGQVIFTTKLEGNAEISSVYLGAGQAMVIVSASDGSAQTQKARSPISEQALQSDECKQIRFSRQLN